MAILDQNQINTFKKASLQQGIPEDEVNSYVDMITASNQSKQNAADTARADDLSTYEDKLKLQQKYSTSGTATPGGLSEIEQEALKSGKASISFDKNANKYVVIPNENQTDPLQWAADNQAIPYLTGRDKATREAQASAMQKLGIEGYLKASALPDLLTDKEVTARDAATNLLNSASSIYAQVQSQNGTPLDVQGVGPLGRFRPGFLTNEQGKTLKQEITNLTANKMKEISGAAISDKEVQRLSKALPQVGDTEGVIMTKAKNIADAIEIGLQMQEMAKRDRLTLDQAYQKYGTQAFNEKGQPTPDWLKGGQSTAPGLQVGTPASQMKVGRFNIQVN